MIDSGGILNATDSSQFEKLCLDIAKKYDFSIDINKQDTVFLKGDFTKVYKRNFFQRIFGPKFYKYEAILIFNLSNQEYKFQSIWYKGYKNDTVVKISQTEFPYSIDENSLVEDIKKWPVGFTEMMIT